MDASGADPGFQVRGDALKKIELSGGRRENFWDISCEKSRFYAKKIIFFSNLGDQAQASNQFLATNKLATNTAICLKTKKRKNSKMYL